MAGKGEGIAVVGGGIAGQSLCEALRERDPDVAITLLCGEPHLPYDRVHLELEKKHGPTSVCMTEMLLRANPGLQDSMRRAVKQMCDLWSAYWDKIEYEVFVRE